MKVGRDYSWWVDYSYSYDLFMEDEQTWKNCVDFDADRFNCPKKDLKKVIKEHIEKYELQGDKYRNLVVTINDFYQTIIEEI